MNDDFVKIYNIVDKKERFDTLDIMLNKHILFLKDIEDYYVDNVSDKTIDFTIYYFNRGINIGRLENAIISSNNLNYIYLFAKNIDSANISRLEDIIVSSLNTWYIYLFARNIKGANISKLEEAIIESNEALAIYSFARNIKGANINKLEDAIVLTGCVELISGFARDVKGCNLDRLTKVINSFNETLDKGVKVKKLECN